MSFREADVLQYYFSMQTGILGVKVYEKTGDMTIHYDTERERILQLLKPFLMKKRKYRIVYCKIRAES